MEDYIIREKLNAISSWLRFNTTFPSWVHNQISDYNADVWDASGFIASLLEISEINKCFYEITELKEYFNDKEFKLLNQFFDQGYLRLSFGYIEGHLLGTHSSREIKLNSEEKLLIIKIKDLNRKQYKITVNSQAFDNLHKSFAFIYKLIPDIDSLKSSGLFEIEQSGVVTIKSRFPSNLGEMDTYAKALARYWSILISVGHDSDIIRFKQWLSKAVCMEEWYNVSVFLGGLIVNV